MKKNFTLDTILFVSALICFVTGILMDFHAIPGGKEMKRPFKLLHTYSGYVMAVGVILHVAWHIDWIKSSARKIFKGGD